MSQSLILLDALTSVCLEKRRKEKEKEREREERE
jgi:hypothetical protein